MKDKRKQARHIAHYIEHSKEAAHTERYIACKFLALDTKYAALQQRYNLLERFVIELARVAHVTKGNHYLEVAPLRLMLKDLADEGGKLVNPGDIQDQFPEDIAAWAADLEKDS